MLDIEIGIPCKNETICDVAGWGFSLLGIFVIASIIFYIYREWQENEKKPTRYGRKRKGK